MTLQLPPPLPPFTTVLGALDLAGRRSAREARDDTVAAVRRTLPARSGRARQGARGAVRRQPDGYVIEVSPSSRVRYPSGVTAKEVTRWIEGGTGIHGPRHRMIRPRRAHAFRLPHGFRTTELAGQRAQHVYARVQVSEEARVERILIDGAQHAARDLEDALTRGHLG